ncbi:unnamed protein product [Closterium sp. NIES-54]
MTESGGGRDDGGSGTKKRLPLHSASSTSTASSSTPSAKPSSSMVSSSSASSSKVYNSTACSSSASSASASSSRASSSSASSSSGSSSRVSSVIVTIGLNVPKTKDGVHKRISAERLQTLIAFCSQLQMTCYKMDLERLDVAYNKQFRLHDLIKD